MKCTLPIFAALLLLAATAAHAQPTEFAPIGAKWWYGTRSINIYPPWSPDNALLVSSYEKYEVTGDTLINGQTYQVIEEEHPVVSGETLFVRQSGNIVYRFAQNGEYVMYDYGKLPSETWNTQAWGFPAIATIEDTATLEVNGTFFPAQVVRVEPVDEEWWWQGVDTVIQNVGGLNFFYSPNGDLVEPVFDFYTKLRCFEYAGETWVFDDEFACEETFSFSTGIDDLPTLDVELTLLPPNTVQVRGMERYNDAQIMLYDLNGRILFQQKLPKTQVQSLVLPDLAMGVYVLRLVADEGVYGRKVLLGK